MKETPLLMQTEMMQAYMAGRKTEIRRLNGLNFINENPDDWDYAGEALAGDNEQVFASKFEESVEIIKSPYGGIGDHLWFREAFAWSEYASDHEEVVWRADKEYTLEERGGCRWRPSIHMPRWASRFTVPITGLRIERLRDIDEPSAIAEGFQSTAVDTEDGSDYTGLYAHEHFLNKFRNYNANKMTSDQNIYGWNPWLWVIQWPRYQSNGSSQTARELHP